MWVDDIPTGRGWTHLWHDKMLCRCGGVMACTAVCPACGAPPHASCIESFVPGGASPESAPTLVYRGAEGRYEDYIFLRMMEREWLRPPSPPGHQIPEVAEKAGIVLLFWSYFETRIERLLRLGFVDTPPAIVEDTLERYSSIGSRLERLYKILFGVTYAGDLKDCGYPDLWTHLKDVQKHRNAFAHGNPAAIDNALVRRVVERMKDEHDAWISIYNKRIRALRSAPSSP